VTNLLVDHCVLVTVQKLDLDRSVSLTVIQLLFSKSKIFKADRLLIDEVLTFKHFNVLISGAAVDFHEVGGCKIALKDVCRSRQFDRLDV